MSQLSDFLYKIVPARENFLETITESEQAIIAEHFAYLQALLAEGKLILAGPCLDASFGICVYRAESPEEAQRIMEQDPAIVKGVMLGELHGFNVALLAGRDNV